MVREASATRTGPAALAACATVLVACGGCGLPGWTTVRVGHASLREAPSFAGVKGGTAIDLSWDFLAVVSGGAVVPHHGDAVGYVCVGLNWGVGVATILHPERQWLIAYTYVGYWNWPDLPENDGVLTGVRIGARAPIHLPGRGHLGLEASFDMKWLNDASENDDARLDTLSFGVSALW